MRPLFRVLRSLGNNLGLAWWGRVETRQPNVVYWFGPFLTRNGLKTNLSIFLEDLSLEDPLSMQHTLMRCRRKEPFTI